ncbi:MAG: Acetyl-CoA carboxylase, carboxyltransferase component [Chloroflexi bacterium]|nr:MAG: Acetyl-CoA carboxylase, carboxyltransferase component [Chloroflexota bacterium]
MVWQDEVGEIEHRRKLATQLGGAERIQRQHDFGKLTIRERINSVLDEGSFEEIGGLAGAGIYEDGRLTGFTPAPFVGGLGLIDGRRVVVGGEDFTVGGGSAIMEQERSKVGFFEDMAREYRVPLVLFMDGAGANVAMDSEVGYSHMPSSFDVFRPLIQAGKEVPTLGALVGSLAGAVAARAMLCHFTVMTEEGGAMFAAGPPVVRRAIGREISKRELGGVEIHVQQSGAVDNAAKDEEDAFRQIRTLLSYLPNNVYELPPVASCDDPIDRADEELLSIVPRNRARPYDMRRIVEMVTDDGQYFEIKPEYGKTVMTIMARIGGYPVGIIANNPRLMGGAMTDSSADKQGHFVEFCDHFHIPLVFLADVPGFMIGPQAEARGTLRHGMSAYWATYNATVPIFTVVTRKNYGMAGQATAHAGRINYRVGWPSGEWGSIPIEGGVDAAYRREIANAPDPDKRRAEIEGELRALRNPFRTAEAFGIEDIIDPRSTRWHIARFLEIAYNVMRPELGIKQKAGVRP